MNRYSIIITTSQAFLLIKLKLVNVKIRLKYEEGIVIIINLH